MLCSPSSLTAAPPKRYLHEKLTKWASRQLPWPSSESIDQQTLRHSCKKWPFSWACPETALVCVRESRIESRSSIFCLHSSLRLLDGRLCSTRRESSEWVRANILPRAGFLPLNSCPPPHSHHSQRSIFKILEIWMKFSHLWHDSPTSPWEKIMWIGPLKRPLLAEGFHLLVLCVP